MQRKSSRLQERKQKDDCNKRNTENQNNGSQVQQIIRSKKRKSSISDPLQNLLIAKPSDDKKKQRLEKTEKMKSTTVLSTTPRTPICSNILNRIPKCRLPKIRWADNEELWRIMHNRPESFKCSSELFTSKQIYIKPAMRTILVDWLMEVCSAYNLHRETFCLSVTFLDRFLNNSSTVRKDQMQLVGVTSLFIASKMEEIYPPNLKEFAEMTDGACTANEIIEFEIVLLNCLGWNMLTMTPNAWLKVYMQILNEGDNDLDNVTDGYDYDDNFIIPQFVGAVFKRVSLLLDLCYLDYQSSLYAPSVLAASAIYYEMGCNVAMHVSGLTMMQLEDCISWMKAIDDIRRKYAISAPLAKYVKVEDEHKIQSHAVNVSLHNEICALRQTENMTPQTKIKKRSILSSPGFLTPPPSDSKRLNCSWSKY